jgi:hypothetical protein
MIPLPGAPFFVKIVVRVLAVIYIINTEAPDTFYPITYFCSGKSNVQPVIVFHSEAISGPIIFT